jgi:hypothetical protein
MNVVVPKNACDSRLNDIKTVVVAVKFVYENVNFLVETLYVMAKLLSTNSALINVSNGDANVVPV